MFDVVIIGAGVVGSFIARKLASYQLNILVIEKENDVGNVTSMANSAIVHSGYDPLPNTLKAKLNVEGNKMFDEICADLDVDFARIGSLTLASNDNEIETLKLLKQRSEQNHVSVTLLNQNEVRKLEPNISPNVIGALFAKDAGIVNPFLLTVRAMENAVDNGVNLHLSEEVIKIEKDKSIFKVFTNKDSYLTKIVINAAGLNSHKINAMVEPIDYTLTPRKGEYFVLDKCVKNLVNHVIFPLPSEKGKGILVSPTTSGNIIVGPSSEINDDLNDTSTDLETLNNVKKQALVMIPNIPFNKVIRVFAGNRPTPSTHDFIINHAKNDICFINVSGIESPGLVSSPAIAEYVCKEFVSKAITLAKKESFNPKVRKHIKPNLLSAEERNKLIKEFPDYGIIVCSCEQISKGEIFDELSRSVPPNSFVAMKKRVRTGFGRCQGGFCQPLILKFMSLYYHKKMEEIPYKNKDSIICKYETKVGYKNVK